MGDNDPSSFKDFDARLKKVRDGNTPQRKKGPPHPLGIAFRVTVELAAGLAVGVAIGYFLDQWLGTRPWLMILFLFLGMGAGVRNVQRAARDLMRAAEEEEEDDAGDDDRSPPS